jgi:hypothetical protein
MKVQVKCGSGAVQAEGDNHADIWKQLAELQEAFGERVCGKCQSDDIRYVHRQNEGGDDFFELRCQAKGCYAKLRMSVRKKEKCFYPKRKAGKDDATGLTEGEWLPSNGWVRWDRKNEKEI